MYRFYELFENKEKSESYRLGLQPLVDEVLPVLAVPLAGVGGGVLRIRGPLGCHVHPSSPQNHLLRRWNSTINSQVNFIYIALFIHEAGSKCVTEKHRHTIK